MPQGFPTIFGACDHPFSFTVERDAGNVACVAFEGENSGRICRPDIVELDSVVSSSSQEAFIWRNAKAVYLRVRVRDGS